MTQSYEGKENERYLAYLDNCELLPKAIHMIDWPGSLSHCTNAVAQVYDGPPTPSCNRLQTLAS